MTPTPAQLAGFHRRRLRTIAASLREMAGEWEDLDQFVVNQLVSLADDVDKAAFDLAIEYADQPRAHP